MAVHVVGPSPSIPIVELAPGSRGVVLTNGQPIQVRRRLRELGFVPGTTVEMVRRLPLGGAVEIAIRGSRFCLRRQDLQGLYVTPIQPSP